MNAVYILLALALLCFANIAWQLARAPGLEYDARNSAFVGAGLSAVAGIIFAILAAVVWLLLQI